MPGDTYTPPRREQSTVFDDGNVLEFRKARDDLRPQSEIEAERDVRSAYGFGLSSEHERVLNPVEVATRELAEVLEARQDRMAA